MDEWVAALGGCSCWHSWTRTVRTSVQSWAGEVGATATPGSAGRVVRLEAADRGFRVSYGGCSCWRLWEGRSLWTGGERECGTEEVLRPTDTQAAATFRRLWSRSVL